MAKSIMEAVNEYNESCLKDFFNRIMISSWDQVRTEGTEILCRTQEQANFLADLIENLYFVDCVTGYYDPAEDKRDNCEDSCTGWYYVNFD